MTSTEYLCYKHCIERAKALRYNGQTFTIALHHGSRSCSMCSFSAIYRLRVPDVGGVRYWTPAR